MGVRNSFVLISKGLALIVTVFLLQHTKCVFIFFTFYLFFCEQNKTFDVNQHITSDNILNCLFIVQ